MLNDLSGVCMFCTKCGQKNSDSSRFCFKCGEKLSALSGDERLSDDDRSYQSTRKLNQESLDKESEDDLRAASDKLDSNEKAQVFQYLKGYHLEFYDGLSEAVRTRFCEIVKTKKFDNVLSNVYVSRDCIMVVPDSRDNYGLALAGLILGGGVGLIGAAGALAGGMVAKIFSNKQLSNLNEVFKEAKDVLIINAANIKVDAYDYRNHWDISGGEWETRIRIEGDAYFNGMVARGAMVFSVEGKTYERTLFAKANKKVPELMGILGLPVPEIKKETKFIW